MNTDQGTARYLANPRACLRTNDSNALGMPRLWRSLKYECGCLHACESGSQAKAGGGGWIAVQNHQRPHATHGGQPLVMVYFNATQNDQPRQKVA